MAITIRDIQSFKTNDSRFVMLTAYDYQTAQIFDEVGVPIIFEGLHIGVSLIQTYIFVILACVYLGEATAHEH